MRIKADGDGQIWAHHGAHAAQHFGFGIVKTHRHHGTVQIKIDAINRPGFHGIGKAADQQGRDAFKSVSRHWSGRIGEAPDQGGEFNACFFRHHDRTRNRRAGWAHGLNQASGALQRWKAAGFDEFLPAGRQRREGMAFM